MNKERYYEGDFNDFLDQLINSGRLTQKEAGIAKYARDNGYDSLSDKQKYVFDKMIKENSVETCKDDGDNIPWCEMLEALDNGGYCSYCQHRRENE